MAEGESMTGWCKHHLSTLRVQISVESCYSCSEHSEQQESKQESSFVPERRLKDSWLYLCNDSQSSSFHAMSAEASATCFIDTMSHTVLLSVEKLMPRYDAVKPNEDACMYGSKISEHVNIQHIILLMRFENLDPRFVFSRCGETLFVKLWSCGPLVSGA